MEVLKRQHNLGRVETSMGFTGKERVWGCSLLQMVTCSLVDCTLLQMEWRYFSLRSWWRTHIFKYLLLSKTLLYIYGTYSLYIIVNIRYTQDLILYWGKHNLKMVILLQITTAHTGPGGAVTIPAGLRRTEQPLCPFYSLESHHSRLQLTGCIYFLRQLGA